MISLADQLERVATALPPVLVSEQSVTSMIEVVATIPWSMISLYGFERPLDDADARADILFASNVATGGRSILCGTNPSVDFAAPWPPINRFCDRWNDPDSPLHAGADDVWFEFDVGSGPECDEPIPSFFSGPRVGHAEDPNYDAKPAMRTILHAGFDALCGGLATETAESLQQCLDLLPIQARIFQTGLMLSRPSRQIRICIDNLSTLEMVEFVESTRGPDDAAHFANEMTILDSMPGVTPRLSVDLGEGIGPRIGVECSTEHWPPFLDTLVKAGTCIPELREAMRSLPTVIPLPGDDSTHILGGLVGREPAIAIALHHAKLTVESGCPTRAKGYISVGRVWLP